MYRYIHPFISWHPPPIYLIHHLTSPSQPFTSQSIITQTEAIDDAHVLYMYKYCWNRRTCGYAMSTLWYDPLSMYMSPSIHHKTTSTPVIIPFFHSCCVHFHHQHPSHNTHHTSTSSLPSYSKCSACAICNCSISLLVRFSIYIFFCLGLNQAFCFVSSSPYAWHVNLSTRSLSTIVSINLCLLLTLLVLVH